MMSGEDAISHITDRRYLHGLENVQSRYFSMQRIWLRMLFMMVWMASLFVHNRLFGAGPVAMVLSVFTVAEWDYITQPLGITISGQKSWLFYKPRPLRLLWEDVAEARTLDKDRGKIFLKMRNGRKVTLVLGREWSKGFDNGSGLGAYALEASIWQHLNKLGKAEALELRPEAESYWAEVPESIPDSATAVVPQGELTAVYAVDSEGLSETWRPTAVDAASPVGLGGDVISFSDATAAFWKEDSSGMTSLIVKSAFREISLATRSGNGEMRDLILATVRQLRKHPATDAVPLPEALLS